MSAAQYRERMTMLDGAASLAIYSETHSAADVTIALGIVPSSWVERGDPRRNGPDSTRNPRPQQVYESSTWILHVSAKDVAAVAPDDDTLGFTTLITLVERLLPLAPALARLRDDYEMHISWYGTSGSHQGGFVMPIELIEGLATLGCSLVGNVYSYDEEDG